MTITATVLKDDDYTLSTTKALQLSTIGLLSLIPLARNYLPFKLKMDFWTRWAVLGLDSFISFTLTFIAVSFLVMPIMLVLILGTKILDHYFSSAFACDMERYGFKQAVKWKLRLK
jgi:Ca2+-dependent lipid-binding protein